MNVLKDAGLDVIAIGKISDIFNGEGVTDSVRTKIIEMVWINLQKLYVVTSTV